MLTPFSRKWGRQTLKSSACFDPGIQLSLHACSRSWVLGTRAFTINSTNLLGIGVEHRGAGAVAVQRLGVAGVQLQRLLVGGLSLGVLLHALETEGERLFYTNTNMFILRSCGYIVGVVKCLIGLK